MVGMNARGIYWEDIQDLNKASYYLFSKGYYELSVVQQEFVKKWTQWSENK